MADDQRLERLYDYTKFHIGIYLSIGGVIASTTTSCQTFDEFWGNRQGPLIFKWFKGVYWTYLEHVSFWISIGLLAYAILSGTAAQATQTHPGASAAAANQPSAPASSASGP